MNDYINQLEGLMQIINYEFTDYISLMEEFDKENKRRILEVNKIYKMYGKELYSNYVTNYPFILEEILGINNIIHTLKRTNFKDIKEEIEAKITELEEVRNLIDK